MSTLFYQTFRANPYPSCVFDRTSLRFLAVNDALAKKYGYRLDELEQMTMLDLYPAGEREAARQVLAKFGDTGRKSLIVEQRTKAGRRVSMLLTILPVDFEGSPAYYATGEEVTKRVTAAQRFRQRDREDHHSAELSRRLTSDVHEDELLASIVNAVSDLMPQADGAAIWMLDEEDAVLVCRAATSYHGSTLEGARVDVGDVEAHDRLRESLRRIMAKHRPDIIRDTSLVAGFREVLPEQAARARTRIAVPLLHRDRAIGFLAAYNYTTADVFGRTDEQLLRLFGALAVAAFRNVALVEEVRTISRHLMQAQETERRRLAHELHDEVGGLLTSLRLSLRMNPAVREDARAELREAEALVSELSAQVRQMSFRLRPNMLDDFGLVPTLEWYGTRFGTLTGIEVDFKHNVAPDRRFEAEIESSVFRIVQEALTNVAKHAGVEEVQVLLFEEDGKLEVHVIDHGRGFTLEERAGPRESLGVIGMTERALLLGGKMTIDTAPGAGTRLTALLPVQ